MAENSGNVYKKLKTKQTGYEAAHTGLASAITCIFSSCIKKNQLAVSVLALGKEIPSKTFTNRNYIPGMHLPRTVVRKTF